MLFAPDSTLYARTGADQFFSVTPLPPNRPLPKSRADHTAHVDGWLPISSRWRRYGTRKFTLLASVPLGVFTFTGPVAAPLGTVAVISVAETCVTFVAGVDPNATVEVLPKPSPVIVTKVPPAPGPELGLIPVTLGA